jgi:pre-mRNA-processing factor 40
VRAGIKDPHWKAIQDPTGREDAFKKYCEDLRAQDKAKEEQRREKLRADFLQMLSNHDEIRHYTRWKTALPTIEGEAVFRSARDDTERRVLFEEYITSLKKAHAEKEAEDKRSALEELSDLLRSLDLEPFTRWQKAEEMLENSEQFSSEKFKPLHKLDFLNTFEKHIRQLQRENNERIQTERRAKHREERKNREAFRGLLSELQQAGKLKAGTKWKEIREQIHDDPRYTAMLGQDGSSPLDLFWDALEEEEGKFRTQRRWAFEVLEVMCAPIPCLSLLTWH